MSILCALMTGVTLLLVIGPDWKLIELFLAPVDSPPSPPMPVTNMSYLTMQPLAENFIHNNVSRSITSLWLSLLPACLPRPTCKLSGIGKFSDQRDLVEVLLENVTNCMELLSAVFYSDLSTDGNSALFCRMRGKSDIWEIFLSNKLITEYRNNNLINWWWRTSLDRLIRLQIWEKIIISTTETRSFQEKRQSAVQLISRLSWVSDYQ